MEYASCWVKFNHQPKYSVADAAVEIRCSPSLCLSAAASSTCTSPSDAGIFFSALSAGQQLHCTQLCDLVGGVTRMRNQNQAPVPQKNRCSTNKEEKKNHCVLLQIFPSLHTCIIQFYIFMSLNIHE